MKLFRKRKWLLQYVFWQLMLKNLLMEEVNWTYNS
jgi:hypothetical protein